MTVPINRDYDELDLGDDVTAWRANGCGQGGILEVKGPTHVTLKAPNGISHIFPLSEVDHWTRDEYLDAHECLDYDPERCSGPVDYWYSGGINGRSWPRCAFHGEKRLRDHDNSIERYADSDVAPDWLDPAMAGERWDDDY